MSGVKRITQIGYQCPVCGEKYFGPKSKIKAETCSLNSIPEAILMIGQKYKSVINGDLAGFKINEIYYRPVLDSNGIPQKHEIVYTGEIFGHFVNMGFLEAELRNWMRSNGPVYLTNEMASKCFPWDDKATIK